MNVKPEEQNTVVLANATAFCVEVLKKVTGEDVADTVQGEYGAAAMRRAVLAKLQGKLSKGH